MRASEEQWSNLSSYNPAVLDVVRHDRAHLDLRTQVVVCQNCVLQLIKLLDQFVYVSWCTWM